MLPSALSLKNASNDCFQLYKLGLLKEGGLDHTHANMKRDHTRKHLRWEMFRDTVKKICVEGNEPGS